MEQKLIQTRQFCLPLRPGSLVMLVAIQLLSLQMIMFKMKSGFVLWEIWFIYRVLWSLKNINLILYLYISGGYILRVSLRKILMNAGSHSLPGDVSDEMYSLKSLFYRKAWQQIICCRFCCLWKRFWCFIKQKVS